MPNQTPSTSGSSRSAFEPISSAAFTNFNINDPTAHSIIPNVQQSVSAGVLHTRPMDMPLKFVETDFSHREIDGGKMKRRSLMSDFHLSHHNPIIPQMPHSGPSATLLKDIGSRRSSVEPHLPPYTPQVENISPTPEDIGDLSNTDKDEILDTIKKVDHEITFVEEKIRKLHKKKQELEEATAKRFGQASVAEIDQTVSLESKTARSTPSLFETIYAENRKKAQLAHNKLLHLDPPGGYSNMFVCRQPWEIESLQEVKRKNEEFKPKLLAYLKNMHQQKISREKLFAQKYGEFMDEWKMKMDRFERNPKRIAKEAKYREIFEKTFPELKKQREERERLMRLDAKGNNAPLKQEYEPLFSYDYYYANDADERMKMRQNAILPPLMLDEWSKKHFGYINNNNYVRDVAYDHKAMLQNFRIAWSDEEKLMFKQKFIQYGKNFAAIAMFFTKKSTQDCVQYYYLTKKRESYKRIMRRPYRRRGKPYKPPQMPKKEDSIKETNELEGDISQAAVVEEPKPEPEYFCIECRLKIDVSNPGRVLTRSCYEQYGLDPLDPSAQDARICARCRLNDVRKHKSSYTICTIGICSGVKRRIKPRIFPVRWTELSSEQKVSLMTEFQIPENTNKCCHSCYKRLHRRIEIILSKPESSQNVNVSETVSIKQETWTEEDVNILKEAAQNENRDWSQIAILFPGKTAEDCSSCFNLLLSNQQQLSPTESESRTKIKLGQVPGIEEEEEEEEQINSDEDTVQSSIDHSCNVSPKNSASNEGTEKEEKKASKCDDIPATVTLRSSSPAEDRIAKQERKMDFTDAAKWTTDATETVPTAVVIATAVGDQTAKESDNESCATLSADESSSRGADASVDPQRQKPHHKRPPVTVSTYTKDEKSVEFMKVKEQPTIKNETLGYSSAILPTELPACQSPIMTVAEKPLLPTQKQVNESSAVKHDSSSVASDRIDFIIQHTVEQVTSGQMFAKPNVVTDFSLSKIVKEENVDSKPAANIDNKSQTVLQPSVTHENRCESPVIVGEVNRSTNVIVQTTVTAPIVPNPKPSKLLTTSPAAPFCVSNRSTPPSCLPLSAPVRGSLTTGRPVVPPASSTPMVGLNVGQVSTPTNRKSCASVDTVVQGPSGGLLKKEQNLRSEKPSGFISPNLQSGSQQNIEAQQQQQQQLAAYEALRQNMEQQALSSLYGLNLPAVQLMNDYHTALQMTQRSRNASPSALDLLNTQAQMLAAHQAQALVLSGSSNPSRESPFQNLGRQAVTPIVGNLLDPSSLMLCQSPHFSQAAAAAAAAAAAHSPLTPQHRRPLTPSTSSGPSTPNVAMLNFEAAAQKILEAQQKAAVAAQQQQQQQMIVDAQKSAAMTLEAQKVAYQRQLVEQHFQQSRLEQQQQQQRMAEHQRMLGVANDMEKMRAYEQYCLAQQRNAQKMGQLGQSDPILDHIRMMMQQQSRPQSQVASMVNLAAAQQHMIQQQPPGQQNLPFTVQQLSIPHVQRATGQHQHVVQTSNASSQQSQKNATATAVAGPKFEQTGSRSQITAPPPQQSPSLVAQKQQGAQMKLLDQLHATIASGLPFNSGRQSSIIHSGSMPAKVSAASEMASSKNNPFLAVVETSKVSMGDSSQLTAQAPPTKAAMKEFPNPSLKKTTSINDLISQNVIQPVSKSLITQQASRSQAAFQTAPIPQSHQKPAAPTAVVQSHIMAAPRQDVVVQSQHHHHHHHRHHNQEQANPGSSTTTALNLASHQKDRPQTLELKQLQQQLPQPISQQQRVVTNPIEKVTAQSLIDSMITKHHKELSNEGGSSFPEAAVNPPIHHALPPQHAVKQSGSSTPAAATPPTPSQQQQKATNPSSQKPSRSSSPNLIQQIDDIILGAYNLRPPTAQENAEKSSPQAIVVPSVAAVIEPVTPEGTPPSYPAFNAQIQNPMLTNAAKLGGVPSFEYNLEPVSPPDSRQHDQRERRTPEAPPPPMTTTRPLPTPQTLNLPPAAAPVVQQRSANASPATIGMMRSVSSTAAAPAVNQAQPQPFVAFNVFTLPNAAPQGGPNVQVPKWMPAAPSSGFRAQGVSATGSEDNESMLAVAALIETELKSDGTSNSRRPSTVAAPATAAQLPAPSKILAQPTYEPLSDDES